jgi:hypothetical protein
MSNEIFWVGGGALMLVGIDSLHKLFSQNPGKKRLEVAATCQDCGCNLKLEIHATSSGFGIQNGALFEPRPDVFCTKCAACYQAKPHIVDCSDTELIPRIA